MDFQKFYMGEIYDAYKYLGAHVEEDGVVFRTFAPQAERVAIIGEFNNWQEEEMKEAVRAQFYEIRIAGAKAGQMYKYVIYGQNGRIEHCDPYGFGMELRPNFASIVRDLSGSDVVIDIHSSNLYLTEIPQVRISETFENDLISYAEHLNTDLIWIHSASTVLEATLAHSLNVTGTPTLVVEMGIGLRLTQAYAEQLVSGIFSLMHYMGIWDGASEDPRKPLVSRRQEDVEYLNAAVSGIFVQRMEHNSYAREGQVIGIIADPLLGESLCEVKAPCDGLIFTLRDFPMVDEGSLVGRMIRGDAIEPELRRSYEERGARMVSSLDLARYRGGAE